MKAWNVYDINSIIFPESVKKVDLDDSQNHLDTPIVFVQVVLIIYVMKLVSESWGKHDTCP